MSLPRISLPWRQLASRSSIASEYGSSPFEQPALHMRSAVGVALVRRCSAHAGMRSRATNSNCAGSRKKYDSPMVSSASSASRAWPGSSTACRNAPTSSMRNAFIARRIPCSALGTRFGEKIRPAVSRATPAISSISALDQPRGAAAAVGVVASSSVTRCPTRPARRRARPTPIARERSRDRQ